MTRHDGRKHAAPGKDATKPKPTKTVTGEARPVELAGVVVDVFGRRFTLEADAARTLVDLGKSGAGLVIVEPGARLRVTGERRKGEIKAQTVAREGGLSFVLRKDKAPKLARDAKTSRPAAKADPKPDVGAAAATAVKSEAKAAPLKPADKTAPPDRPQASKSDAPA